MKTKYKIEVEIQNRRYILTSREKCEMINFDTRRGDEVFHEFVKSLDKTKLENKKLVVDLFNATVARLH